MHIRVSSEVAVGIIVVLAIVCGLLAAVGLGRGAQQKRSPGAHRAVVIAIGSVATLAALGGLSRFLLLMNNRDPVHPGLTVVGDGAVLLTAILFAVAGSSFVWARLRALGVVVTLAGSAAFVAKPFVWPYLSRWGSGRDATLRPYGVTSEAHLYFLLPGLALLVLGLIFLVTAFRGRRASGPVAPPLASAVVLPARPVQVGIGRCVSPGGDDREPVPMGAALAKRFWLGSRMVSFEAQPGSDGWRVLVNGRPVPMTFRETDSSVGSSGFSRHSVIQPPRPVEWVALGAGMRALESFEVNQRRAPGEPPGFRAFLSWSGGHVDIQGTAVYSHQSVTLLFPEDATHVDVDWTHHFDSSV